MLKVVLLSVPFVALLAASCNPAQGACQKTFDCQDQLGLKLEDDFVGVCTAEFEGENNALRQNAEKQCKDLADAEVAVATCEGGLGCDDLKKARNGEETLCKKFEDDFQTALDATHGRADCDAVEDAGGEGEGAGGAGEGEGEGEGAQ